MVPLSCLIGVSFAVAPAAPAPVKTADVVAVQAGTIHLVEGGRVIEGGGTILVENGRILAVGKDVAIPPTARVVDYGADAVIVPGLVAATSRFTTPYAAPRAAEPELMAIDHFDPYSTNHRALAGGVTTTYLQPARGRLIAGQGAVVKAAGADEASRILSESAVIHGAISAEARSTPGYWVPPVPATVDVGLGVVAAQLPRTTMGAIVALSEQLAYARGGAGGVESGPYAGQALRKLIDAKRPWRMGAEKPLEIRALLAFFSENDLPLVIDGASGAGEVAEEIAAAGVSVIYSVPLNVNSPGRDFGKGEDTRWPDFSTASHLAAAGVKFAIATPGSISPGELLLAAAVASRGGLDGRAALRAITLSPAEILGVADRVGSISVGKDADLVVLTGPPLAGGGVAATWVGGEVAYKAKESASATVLEVEELHVGDGRVLSPGQLLMRDGKIVAVGRSVARPSGAVVVRGHAAMPGMIDALGHLGLEGSRKPFSSRFDLTRIVEPGDRVDRRVARAGVTTVLLGSRAEPSGNSSPTMAYKPAGMDVERMVIPDSNALRMRWSDDERFKSGEKVRDALEKAQKYKEKWEEYEKELSEWVPPVEKTADEEKAEGKGEKEEEAEEKKDEGDDDKKKKKKKKKDEEEPPRPVTGVWEGKVAENRLRFRILDTDGALEGNMRCAAFSDDLVEITGARAEKKVSLTGLGSRGAITAELELAKDKLSGKVTVAGEATEVEVTQTSDVYEIAARPKRRKVEEPKPPKGEPRSPGINPDLEPLRQAMLGKGAVIVTVDRDDEILACVSAFEKYEIKPVLFGADKAWKVAEEISGRVAGVILSHRVTATSADTGLAVRNRYAELANAGIPVAFHSAAEEGAADLPLIATYAVARGLSGDSALRGLTADAAAMLAIGDHVGTLARGLDADVLLLDGSPLEPATSVLRVWVNGKEIH